MYRVDLYIDGQKADLFQEESIEINLSTQNIKDISKVFGDFTQSFTIPASSANNKMIFGFFSRDPLLELHEKLKIKDKIRKWPFFK